MITEDQLHCSLRQEKLDAAVYEQRQSVYIQK